MCVAGGVASCMGTRAGSAYVCSWVGVRLAGD